ncbi:MAG: hypothetical protein ABIG46_01890 [Candidatus Omnitrophota bacterium]
MTHSGFNPKARWDRHIPETDDHQPDELNERIQVLAWFKNSKLIPRYFVWNNQKYRIREVTYNWQEKQGSQVINCFSVSTGTNLYQISFNNITLGWRINRIIE